MMTEIEYLRKQAEECEEIFEIDSKFFRKEENGCITEMHMFDPVFGWLSLDELFELRQTQPRLAP